VKAAIALWIATVSLATGQQLPKSPCDFDGFDTNSKLAEVAKPTTAYYGCAVGRCLSMALKLGDPVVSTRAEGDWTCGYLVARKGSAQGWVPSAYIRPLPLDPNPSLDAWVGKWVQKGDSIIIVTTKTPGKLDLEGEAYWHGVGGNVHSGSLSGEVRPVGNKLHYSEGDICTVDLVLLGKYMLANDNNMCGGMNVRFWGLWRRAGTR
jgi:hypothetical protein